ncbi:MAG: NUDIX domain-containing protein [Candidatus Liptonbacteria bacterium]|nr:NUDIX domain-containing protein [Candidatus Liptonbacteria bacterium]
MANTLELVVRMVIIYRRRMLFCRMKGQKWFFLPGGHTEFGERILKTLRRELKEELGVRERSARLIGTAENIYLDRKYGRDRKRHEINFVFRVKLSEYALRSREGHIEFVWLTLAELRRARVLPAPIKRLILRTVS